MTQNQGEERLAIIDCDVHNGFRSHNDLFPYLEDTWKSQATLRGGGLPYASPIGNKRKDANPPSGLPVGADPDYMIEQLIEPFGMEYVLLCSAA